MIRSALFAIVLLLQAFSPAAQGQTAFDAGLNAYADGMYSEAARHWQQASGNGDPRSAFNLAVLYEHGKGVSQDIEQAVALYHNAAKKNFIDAQFSLANILLAGPRGVEKNVDAALMWYLRAADAGHIQSQYKLGLILSQGELVEPNIPTAQTWLELASRNGHYEAESLLHRMRQESTRHMDSEHWVMRQDPDAWTVVLYRDPDAGQARNFVSAVGLQSGAMYQSIDGTHYVVAGVFLDQESATQAVAGLPEPLRLRLPAVKRFSELHKGLPAGSTQ